MEDVSIFLSSTFDPGDVRKLNQKTKKHQSKYPVKIVPNSIGGNGIGNFLENAKQLF